MLLQEVVMDNDSNRPQEVHERHSVPPTRLSRSDVAFPLATPRKRAPSVASVVDLVGEPLQPDGQTIGVVTVCAVDSPCLDAGDSCQEKENDPSRSQKGSRKAQMSLNDLPLEVQGKILDFIFGDMHSVYVGSTSLRGKSVSSLMRHPRRKAVSDFALVSPAWRDMVQERIYRHIKIKGTRAGLKESETFFSSHAHLRKLVRHIEFWVPVWGDKAPFHDLSVNPLLPRPAGERNNGSSYHLVQQASERDLIAATDVLGFSYAICAYSATLSEIFAHINDFFPHSLIFTLEGGHCKKSNMIRHFPKTLFPDPNQRLDKLPNIRTFAMRGAWNIMRNYQHWKTIEDALPNVEEWHCAYARPRPEADATINEVLTYLPSRLRHVNISLDGMYGKEPIPLGSSLGGRPPHLCDQIGRVLPHVESLSFRGKICECLWTSACSAISSQTGKAEEPKLKHLEIVVKSCCRQRVTATDPKTGETFIQELGGIIADGAGLTNLVFIKALERLVLNTVEALPFFPNLEYVRIRYIDLDSPCTLLNPYWLLEHGKVYGIWNEEIVERLSQVMPDVGYVELEEGIECTEGYYKHMALLASSSNHASTGIGGPPAYPYGGPGRASPPPVLELAPSMLWPKSKPRSIKTTSYKIIADVRGG
ncbi:uncharacterized protein Z520_10474 [Fonsecaea multimorphosa CBS 102226]|uniref:Uncharacterized protein n=1 Tax=Fonsecaea multimorphosa CBS 102226 TaxID=1442371 RepID=A0A0D2JTP3_9EURO|nr:uncharacterized protein Z520_10474 [Fonsecaea multimorphosa CBS 102226]KIX93849.1 hypothetical protein Z520_10474 [Fonsecaea multimorphosa CBS 102226]OAL19088.1 hypothetical protein AYO22_10036 [Fonsecaea multimorphosa]